VFVDGFNLYFALLSVGSGAYLWLDLVALSERLLRPGQDLVGVDYFTATARHRPESAGRQAEYLRAIDAVRPGMVTVHKSRFQKKSISCPSCDTRRRVYEEKQSDVALGVTMVAAAMRDEFDLAILVSEDSDFVPAVQAVVSAGKRVVVAMPPNRRAHELVQVASGYVRVTDSDVHKSQLPSEIAGAVRPAFHLPASSARASWWPCGHLTSD